MLYVLFFALVIEFETFKFNLLLLPIINPPFSLNSEEDPANEIGLGNKRKDSGLTKKGYNFNHN